MNRLSQVVFLFSVALGMLVPAVPASAGAGPIGGVIIIPGSGSDLTAVRLRTSAGCPAQANAYNARMKGHGFPPDGEIVTSTISAGISHSFGFDVYFGATLEDYAQMDHTTLVGRYDITVACVDGFTQNSFGEFTGSLTFDNPSHYEALGAAKPSGPPPPPLALAGDGSALRPAPPPPAAAPPAAAPPAAAPQSAVTPPARPPTVARTPSAAAGGQPMPPTPVQQMPSADPGLVTAERNGVTGQSVPWLILVLIGAALVVVVSLAVNRVLKRRSP